MLLNVIKNEKYCQRSTGIDSCNTYQQQYWHWYPQYFIAISIISDIDNSFHKYY